MVATAMLLLSGFGTAFPAPVPLHITVLDAGLQEPVAARAYLWQEGKPILPEGFSPYRKGREQHFLVPGNFTLQLAPGNYRLRLEKGLEYLPVESSFRLERRNSLTFRLKRWIDMNREGYFSADMHVHRDPRDLSLILLAEDLNFAPTITTHVWSRDVSTPWPIPPDFVIKVDDTHLYTANSQEVERIQGGPGAVILLGRSSPLPFSGYQLYPPSITYTREIHARGGFVEGDKPFWLDTFVNAALGEIDFIELNCNHFVPRDVETDISRWSCWSQEEGYSGRQGFADWVMSLYYRLLNCGFELPLSAGSANGVKETPVGYNRVYARVSDFGYRALLEALKAGRSFTTNGPIVEMTLNGRFGPGSKTELRAGRDIELEARVRSRTPLERVEVVLNGRVAATFPASGAEQLEIRHKLNPEQSSWVAIRAFAQSSESVVFGHTSPAWLLVDGHSVRVPEDARYLLDKVDRLIEYTENVEGFKQKRHRQETLALYRQARAIYERLAVN